MGILVSELWVYPVKGMAGNPVASLKFDEHGPVDDRRWMLMDQQGTFLSQRRFPHLGLFKANMLGNQLTIEAPDGVSRVIPVHACTQPVRARVWSDDVAVMLAPKDVNEWLSGYFDEPVYLVRYRPDLPRKTSAQYVDATVGFADGFPLLLCSTESLNALNEDAPVQAEMLRFRPNIVFSGAPAWSEQYWQSLQGEHHNISVVKPCTRCAVITLRPGTTEKEPRLLKHLMTLSQWEKQPVFGQNAVLHGHEQPLRLGSQFEVTLKEPELAAEPTM